jgi:hypothetical protein
MFKLVFSVRCPEWVQGWLRPILALTFPEDHGVIDFRVWKVIFETEKRSFTPQDYVKGQ